MVKQLSSLSSQQVSNLARLMGLDASAKVTEITQYNHVWQFCHEDDIYFLKIFTKSWYGDDAAGTAFCVRHEQDAYRCLAAYGLTTPEIILARLDTDNPLERPFIVTRKLKGEPLMSLLQKADASQFQTLLEKTGEYMGRMHAIRFAFPGYIIGDGPTALPDENSWQHPCWSAKKTQQEVLATLEADRPSLSVKMATQLNELFSTMEEQLAEVFQPPHFVQANCHVHHFHLWQADDDWQVSGCIDMEVASAGCYLYDLLGFSIQMAAFFPATTRWWQPFFHGYGREPNFSLFKLMMLGIPEFAFKIYGETRWAGTRQQILSRLWAALNWQDLFMS